jgi:hypothetical protein
MPDVRADGIESETRYVKVDRCALHAELTAE